MKSDAEQIIIASGIETGELVCLTALEFVVEGMKVDPVSLDGTALKAETPTIAEVPESNGDQS